MAEFQEVCKQWRRMCEHGSEDYACADCKMYSSVDESVCRGIPDKDEAKIIEGFVMSWAAENPEPVYPTWYDYLYSVTRKGKKDEWPITDHDFCKWLNKTPIPADIAEKLGIKPKE